MEVSETVIKFDSNGNVIYQKERGGYEAWLAYK